MGGDNFSRNLTSLSKQIQEAESEFRRAASGVDNFEKSVSGTQSQLTNLQQKLENAYARQGKLTECGAVQRGKQALCHNGAEAEELQKPLAPSQHKGGFQSRGDRI